MIEYKFFTLLICLTISSKCEQIQDKSRDNLIRSQDTTNRKKQHTDQIPSAGQFGGYQYLPPPHFLTKDHDADCSPCNIEPWVPIVGHSKHSYITHNVFSSHGSHKLQYEPSKPNYGPPIPDYIPPKDTVLLDYMLPPPIHYKLPTLTYGLPKNSFQSNQNSLNYGMPPKVGYGPPKQQYGPPQQNFIPPKPEYGPPKQTYGPPQQDFTPPKLEYGPPTSFYGPPPIQGTSNPSIFNPPPLPNNNVQEIPENSTPQQLQFFDTPKPQLSDIPLDNGFIPPPLPSDSYGNPVSDDSLDFGHLDSFPASSGDNQPFGQQLDTFPASKPPLNQQLHHFPASSGVKQHFGQQLDTFPASNDVRQPLGQQLNHFPASSGVRQPFGHFGQQLDFLPASNGVKQPHGRFGLQLDSFLVSNDDNRPIGQPLNSFPASSDNNKNFGQQLDSLPASNAVKQPPFGNFGQQSNSFLASSDDNKPFGQQLDSLPALNGVKQAFGHFGQQLDSFPVSNGVKQPLGQQLDSLPASNGYGQPYFGPVRPNVEIQKSVKVADYVASVEYPINIVQSPLVELQIGNEADRNRNAKTNKFKLSENPIVVEDTHAAASSIKDEAGQKSIQIIVPYTKKMSYTTLLPTYNPPMPNDSSDWLKYQSDLVVANSNRNSFVHKPPYDMVTLQKNVPASNGVKPTLGQQLDTFPASNGVKQHLGQQLDTFPASSSTKRSLYDMVTLQKNIDDWTQQSFSKNNESVQIVYPKQIPGDYKFADSKKNDVYVVTPQPYSFVPKIGHNISIYDSQKFSIRIEQQQQQESRKKMYKNMVIYSEWPHIINSIQTTTIVPTITNPPTLFGLVGTSAYTPPPNSTVETILGHSKVVNVVTSSTKEIVKSTTPTTSNEIT